MTPVDLNRLREAQRFAGDFMGPLLVDLVLDAPTADVTDVHVTRDQGLIQWVVTLVGIGEPPAELADRVALVPVKGP